MKALLEFIFPRRLHRLAYFFRGLVADSLTYILCASITMMGSNVWWGLLIGFQAYVAFFVVLPRIRDIEMSGLWLLVMLVPVANIIFGIILLFRAPALIWHRPNKPLHATAAAPGS